MLVLNNGGGGGYYLFDKNFHSKIDKYMYGKYSHFMKNNGVPYRKL